jgi:plasmid stabilization system protein ParE
MKRLIVRPEAEADITKAAIWYASREAELGLELLADIQRSITLALRNPRAFLCIRKSPEVRRVLVKKFPYRIFYIVERDLLVVFAVLHAARHERIWRRRLLNINRLIRP